MIAGFLELSAELTGFDVMTLRATDVADEYLEALREGAGEANANDLITEARGTPVVQLWNDRRFGPLARNVVLMWYLGRWYRLPSGWQDEFGGGTNPADRVVSARAYQEGLVWAAMGAHPPGAKPPGYGSWADEPLGAK